MQNSSSFLSKQKDTDHQLVLKGTNVTPHMIAKSMRYHQDPEPASGARVQLFLHNNGPQSLFITNQTRVRFNGKFAQELLTENIWAWHDTPSARNNSDFLAPDHLTVWTFNSRNSTFGPNGEFDLEIGPENKPWFSSKLSLTPPKCWLSAVTFLASEGRVHPEKLVIHVANTSTSRLCS